MQKQVREGRGGVVESKKRIEQWRESMFPMQSIELSIILLQLVDGSSLDEEWSEEERKKWWRGCQCERREQVAPAPAAATCSAE